MTMTTSTSVVSPPPSSSSLRYVPQGPASLSSDAPGWSGSSAGDNNKVKLADGPICWKCRGARFFTATSSARRQQQQQQQQQQPQSREESNDSCNDKHSDDDTNNNVWRACPVCRGSGHLPTKLKYLQSILEEKAGAITRRRRRKEEWVEFGHIPGAVRAALYLLSSMELSPLKDPAAGYHNNDNDIEDDSTAVMHHAITLLSQAYRIRNDDSNSDNDTNNYSKDIPVCSTIAQAWMTGGEGEEEDEQHPAWLPAHPGEQLCNLVGYWRILQRKASHRWTTDDIVTAYVAASTFVTVVLPQMYDEDENNHTRTKVSKCNNRTLRYLDLGTGNASVLQMVAWYFLSSSLLPPISSSTLHSSSSLRSECKGGKDIQFHAVGVEARSEAVNLARRSLSFNLGAVKFKKKLFCGAYGIDNDDEDDDDRNRRRIVTSTKNCNVQIVKGDFRDLISSAAASSTPSRDTNESQIETNYNEKVDNDTEWTMDDVASKRYDLITGTPPYFRVGFTTTTTTTMSKLIDKNSTKGGHENDLVTCAVIEQGGMPTSMQSAPARCEFRGGIEAYCLAASAMLATPHGIFVVCENWANDARVWKGAAEAGLTIVCVWPVNGGGKHHRQGQTNILFAIYIMKKEMKTGVKKGEVKDGALDCNEDARDLQFDMNNIIRPTLVVRDENGKWTGEYANIMNAMSIPT